MRSGASTRTAYVARLERALGFLAKRARRAPAVMGYCMGGTLTVALAARQPRRVAGLALLAAPWDFHADRTGHAFLVSTGPLLAQVADRVGELPVDILQTLFWSLDPWLAVKKFGRFLGMDQQGEQARDFVLLEDWLNDGAPLAGPVARECLVGWYGDNIPGSGKWVVGGRRIVPSRIKVPSLVMIPSGDRIVPPLSAAALADPSPRPQERDASRPAARPHRHGGERPRARSLLDTVDRLAGRHPAQAASMTAEQRSFDWRVPAVWAVLLDGVDLRACLRRTGQRSAPRQRSRLWPCPGCRDLKSSRDRGAASGSLLDASSMAHWRDAAQPRDPRARRRSVQHHPHVGHGRPASAVVQRHPGRALRLSADRRPARLRVRQGRRSRTAC